VRYRRHWIAPLDEVGGLALGRYTGLYGFSRLVLFLIKSYARLVVELSPQLKVEVQTFVESLLSKSNQPIKRKLRQDWAGMLKTDYTSIELQHLVC